MVRLLLLAALLLNGWGLPPARPQTGQALTGRVLDLSTHQPVPGAVVLLPNLQQSTATGPDDTFTLPGASCSKCAAWATAPPARKCARTGARSWKSG